MSGARGKPTAYHHILLGESKCIGGIASYDLWVTTDDARGVYQWQCALQYALNTSPDGLYSYGAPIYEFDVYESLNPSVQSTQLSRLRELERAITNTDFEAIGTMILCFAPHLLQGNLTPRFKKYRALLGEALKDAKA